ncbi:MAG: hypothetical protein ACPG46_01370 [Thalassotalea sp.]
MINSVNTYNHLFNTGSTSSSSASEIDSIITEHQQSNTTVEQEEVISPNLYLSTRSQKISALSAEFFSAGALNFTDVNALTERVYQLGLISKQDYANLTDAELAPDVLEREKEISSQNLALYIDDFLQRLDESDAGEEEHFDNDIAEEESETLIALMNALSTAKTILTNVETAKKEDDFKESLASSLSILKQTIHADSFEKMPLDDKVGLSKVYQALEIVDKISPQRLSNDKLNRYMEFSLE